LRVELSLRGLHPVPQLEVFDGDRFVARLDLAFEAERVAVEYDGGWHAAPSQIQRDGARRDRLRALGWIVIVVTNKQLRDDLGAVVSTVRSTLAGRRAAISMEINAPISIEIA
jgi:very-short-patch-repair endonuclease